MSPTSIFAPASTPADSIFGLSIFVLLNVAAIFIVVFALLAYVVVRFRNKRNPRGQRSLVWNRSGLFYYAGRQILLRSRIAARLLLKATIVYLPLQFVVFLLWKG
jgi:hypothetical protein